MSLVSTFLDNTNLVLKELHLAGNNLGFEDINYLLSQMNVNGGAEEGAESRHIIWPYLRILNLNGVRVWRE